MTWNHPHVDGTKDTPLMFPINGYGSVGSRARNRDHATAAGLIKFRVYCTRRYRVLHQHPHVIHYDHLMKEHRWFGC